MDKTLGQIEFEAHKTFYVSNGTSAIINTTWEGLSQLQRDAMEAGAAAVRDATLEQCNKIVQLARAGEIDNDYRSISYRIQSLKRDWHDEDGKY